MKKRRLIIGFFIVFLAAFLGAAGCLIYMSCWKVTWEEKLFTETSKTLDNPYCGWYQMYGYMLSDDGGLIFEERTKEYIEKNKDNRLVLLEFNLKQFRDRDLSETSLTQIKNVFSQWSDSKCAIIVRFLYDWDGKALVSEPENISQIQRHMQQTSEIVNAYADTVYVVQGIFVGNYGEMNNSAYLSAEDMILLAQTLRELLNKNIYMAVRTPAQLRTVLGSADTEQPVGIGLFNDGLLASETDLGTYGSENDVYTKEAYENKGGRQQELLYQSERSLHVPSGGEVVSDNVYNDIENAVKDLRQMRISYLNSMYDTKVISKWKNQSYQGKTGYDYITSHLGYRYELKGVKCDYKAFQKEGAELEITVKNTGFSPSYKSFDIVMSVCDIDGNVVYEKNFLCEHDTAVWYPDEEYQLTCTLPVSELGKGRYNIYFNISDKASGEQILFAVEEAPEEKGYFLGILCIDKQ